MRPENARLARLRGSVEPVDVGARGIESVARNVECLRLRALITSGITPTVAVAKIFGGVPDAMSPFAMVLSQNFERRLLANAGGSILTAYREKGLLTQGEAKISSISDVAIGDSQVARLRREQETRRMIALKLARSPQAPNLILKPQLPIDLVGVTHAVEFDYLVAADDDPTYRIGVIKSYADRGGKTDKSDIRSACREAAVGTIALSQLLKDTGHDPDMAGDKVDLILRAPGSFTPRLFPAMKASSELASLRRALSSAPRDLDGIEDLIPDGGSLADANILEQLPNRYRASCKEHCALWERCRAQAHADGLPVILGDQAAELLAPAGTLDRVYELLEGGGRPPESPAEATLAEEMRQAALLLERIANG
ncbi:hypothetical protein [Roseovarius sp. C03]|uniref:hypothetical protein n=1 Tax=Roseovarius sp. C03 TaxID=3449222 RepID=UPI003EDC32CD